MSSLQRTTQNGLVKGNSCDEIDREEGSCSKAARLIPPFVKTAIFSVRLGALLSSSKTTPRKGEEGFRNSQSYEISWRVTALPLSTCLSLRWFSILPWSRLVCPYGTDNHQIRTPTHPQSSQHLALILLAYHPRTLHRAMTPKPPKLIDSIFPIEARRRRSI